MRPVLQQSLESHDFVLADVKVGKEEQALG
jgi:hypothetical protein